ncbi:MAG TPA: 3D domain-containing protein [Blastocatellia bacterium]
MLLISLSGLLQTAYAADDPATPNVLEIPGSFKELPDAGEAVTAKRASVPNSIVAASTELMKLEIDAEKVAADKMPAGRINAGRNNARSIPVEVVEVDSVEGALIDFDATAYCLSGRTASGVGVRPGIIAADPRVLPIGTVVHLRAGSYTGIYTVMDTGGLIKGRKVDVYVPTRKEAMQFGRRQVKIKVIGRNRTKPDRSGRTILASEE